MIRYQLPARLGLLVLTGLGCAEASAPLPAPLEVLLVLNQGDASLSVIPVESPLTPDTIPIGAVTPPPPGMAARGSWALVPLGAGDAVVVVDLGTRTVARTIGLAAGSGATGATGSTGTTGATVSGSACR